MNDYQIALQCQQQYDGIIPTVNVAGVDYSVAIDDGAEWGTPTVCVICEGSHDAEDAMHDLEALMQQVRGIGGVHSGAWSGIENAAHAIGQYGDGNRLISFRGHSLGAIHAVYLTIIFGEQGYKNIECITFGLPLFGDQETVDNFNQYKNRTYQNYLDFFNHDLFTTIPVHLTDEPYVIPPNRTRFWSPPTPDNEYKDFGRLVEAHSLKDCYIPGLQKLCATS